MITRFLFNLALAVLWCALTGSATAWNFIAGLIVGAGVIVLYGLAMRDRQYFTSLVNLVRFFTYFVRILIRANLQVAWEVLTPSMHQTPRILRYSVRGLSDTHVTTLASAITLTPGTLAVDVSPDGEYLYIHCMYAEDRERAVAEIDELARRLRETFFA